MIPRSFRPRKVDAQLASAVQVLARELAHMLVVHNGLTQAQADASVAALIDLPGLPEKLRLAA